MPIRVTLTLLTAWALDLGLSALGGYSLRTDVGLLAVLDLISLSLPVLITLGGVHVLPRAIGAKWTPGCSPWTSLLVAAWLPLTMLRLWREHDLASVLVQMAIVGGLLAAVAMEARRGERKLHRKGALGVFAAAITVLLVSTMVPLPGRSLLTEPAPGRGRPSSEGPNLLVIVLDTTRADHLGAYGYARDTSPWLDRFSLGATVYEHAVTSSTWTLPAHASLFTGLHTLAHGAHEASQGGVSLDDLGLMGDRTKVRPLASEALTLAEILHAEGMHTGAICANSAFLFREFGLDQGFDTYVDERGVDERWRPLGLSIAVRLAHSSSKWIRRLISSNERYYLLAPEVNRLALQWLEPRKDERFFLFLNYMDPHSPYLPQGRYRGLYPRAGAFEEVDHEVAMERPEGLLVQERDALVDPYDAEIRYLDDHLATLFAQLDSWELLENTVVVFVGDHGESLGEHGKIGHAVSVYEPEGRIPLVVRLQGQSEGERVRRPVHIVDVLPSVLDALGLEVPSDVQGNRLAERSRTQPVVAYLGEYDRDLSAFTLYRDEWKLIWRSNGVMELYRYREDPEELDDLSAAEPDVVADLTRALEEFRAATRPRFEEVPANLSPEALRRLKGLGYVE